MGTSPDEALDVWVIRAAWSRATSASPEEWSPARRSRGQCAVTALVVQDCLDGKLIRTMVTYPDGHEESHYANLVDPEAGVIYDLTWSQFPEGVEHGPWEERTREYVLSHPDTRDRYALLCRRLNELRTLERVQKIGVPV